ncbi:MAG TPA: 4Fe-4S dicluster domain-containing protein [bacterium]|nr:4Fe-4S dicluster domain-containing protein [bacterium]
MEPINRRKFIKSLFCTVLGVFLPDLWAAGQKTAGLIRPPGAVVEESFNDLCWRCGLCFKVCPAKCLKPVPPGKGLTRWQTPHLIPRQAGCLRCGSCGRVCPSGAIRLVEMESVKMGTASIEPARCLVWTHQKECLVCLEYCPVGAIILDGKGRPVVEPSVCVGCGLCEQHCPVLGAKAAITVTPAGEKRYYLKERRYQAVLPSNRKGGWYV